jgi:predicted Fe-Mo cluster-binding NifX family protein
MKIAVCTQSNDLQSAVDSRFGRTAWFAVYDEATGQWEFIPNHQNLQAAQGAGIQSAQTLIDAEADVLLACNVGPKAMTALEANGITVFSAPAGQSLQQTFQAYTAGQLTPMQQANVEGHWV